jgi:hypothetical protein
MTATTSRRREVLPILERDVQKLMTDALELYGFSWCHFRPARTAYGWRTPVSGPLGAGFPDVLAAFPATGSRPGRVLLLEVKGSTGRLSPAQREVHATLRAAGLEVLTVTPETVDSLLEELAR